MSFHFREYTAIFFDRCDDRKFYDLTGIRIIVEQLKLDDMIQKVALDFSSAPEIMSDLRRSLSGPGSVMNLC